MNQIAKANKNWKWMMIFCGRRKSQIKENLINHSYDSLIKHGKARKRIAFRWCKSAGNIWQLSNLFMVLHDLMLLSVTSLDFCLLSHRSNETWRQPNVSKTCPSHWQPIRRSLVDRGNLDSGKRHLVSENLSASYIQTNCTSNSAAQGTTQNQDNTL